MSILKKLFGLSGQPPVSFPAAEPAAAGPMRPAESLPYQADAPSRGRPKFEEVGETGLYGLVETSPDGSHRIVVGSLLQANGTDRPRDGAYAVLEGGRLKHEGRAERPHHGKIADSGAFILNDGLHGEGLKSLFLAFRADGSLALRHRFEAIVGENAISADGAFAACQTYNSPGSADACIVALFELESGKLLARISPECTTAAAIIIDTALREVCLHTADGDVERYDFDGQMVDRQDWTRRRVARGDLIVIARLLERGALSLEQRGEIEAGLTLAQSSGETWAKAKALRLLGEMREAAGDLAGALIAFDEALLLDPQVGVARKADKLRAASSAGSKPGARKSRFQAQAERLSILHERIALANGGPKQWRFLEEAPFAPVEIAALDHYLDQGWSGAAAEGGLILTLIKAASFPILAERNADTFIEALYAQNVAFDEDRFATSTLVQHIRESTKAQLEVNWRIISRTAGETPAFYPRVRWPHVAGLYEALGSARLAEIAEIFATAPYDFRAGWPDLTLWREQNVCFVEVKSPTDQMHASQARLISGLLKPLGFSVTLAEVVKRTA